jgi:O-antigen/teichoic acid export membrane protein
VVFVRYYTKSVIGEYETLLFVASAVSFFWLRGILQTFLSLIDNTQSSNKSNSYYNAFLLLTAFSLLTVLFLVIFKHSIEQFVVNKNQIPYFNWLLLYIFFSTPSFLIEYIYLGNNKPKKIIIYGIVSYGFQFLSIIIPTVLNYPIEAAIIGLVVTSILRFAFLITVLYKYADFTLSVPFLKQHFKLAYPLIASSLLSGSSQYIDGIIITRLFDPATFAVYIYGAREFPLIVILANALSTAMIPEFTRLNYTDALSKMKSSSRQLMHFLFPVSLVLIILSNVLFSLFFTEQFIQSAKIFNIYLLLIVARLIFPETVLIGRRYTSIFLYVSFFEILINVSLSLFLVKQIGISGVAYATVIANLFERITLVIIVKLKYNTKMSEYIPLKCYSFYSIAFVIAYYVVDFLIFT